VIRVLIADDQELIRAGFRAILESQPDLAVVAEAGTGAEAVDAARRTSPDVALMDIRMPVLDGIAATSRITASGTRTKVLVLTTFDLDGYVYGALRAGASGFLLKNAPRDQLLDAVRIVARGDALFSPTVTRRLVESYVSARAPASVGSPAAALSPRSVMCSVSSHEGCPTPRSPRPCTCRRRRSRRTWPGCSPSSASGTAPRPSCSPSRPGSSDRGRRAEAGLRVTPAPSGSGAAVPS